MKIKTAYEHCPYITAGKEYEEYFINGEWAYGDRNEKTTVRDDIRLCRDYLKKVLELIGNNEINSK